MSQQQTLPGLGNAISSPESADGRSPPDSPAGQTTASCGPAAARASRSASRASNAAPTTNGTYGPTSFESSESPGLLSGWANRLRQRLARTGSTECYLTWKESATPAGRPLSRLVPSMGRIVVIESGSSLELALWVTASARDWKDTPGMVTTRPDGRSRIDQLPRQVAAALFATPTSLAPAKGRNNEAGNSAGLVSIRAHALAASRPLILNNQSLTPPRCPHGTDTHGSSGTTAKRGASPSLNPAFVCWLMGYPRAVDDCAPTAMPSSRKSRRK